MLQQALERASDAKDHDLACDLYLDLSASLEEANETQKALQAALTGGKTPEQAMKDAQVEATRLLRPYQ